MKFIFLFLALFFHLELNLARANTCGQQASTLSSDGPIFSFSDLVGGSSLYSLMIERLQNGHQVIVKDHKGESILLFPAHLKETFLDENLEIIKESAAKLALSLRNKARELSKRPHAYHVSWKSGTHAGLQIFIVKGPGDLSKGAIRSPKTEREQFIELAYRFIDEQNIPFIGLTQLRKERSLDEIFSRFLDSKERLMVHVHGHPKFIFISEEEAQQGHFYEDFQVREIGSSDFRHLMKAKPDLNKELSGDTIFRVASAFALMSYRSYVEQISQQLLNIKLSSPEKKEVSLSPLKTIAASSNPEEIIEQLKQSKVLLLKQGEEQAAALIIPEFLSSRDLPIEVDLPFSSFLESDLTTIVVLLERLEEGLRVVNDQTLLFYLVPLTILKKRLQTRDIHSLIKDLKDQTQDKEQRFTTLPLSKFHDQQALRKAFESPHHIEFTDRGRVVVSLLHFSSFHFSPLYYKATLCESIEELYSRFNDRDPFLLRFEQKEILIVPGSIRSPVPHTKIEYEQSLDTGEEKKTIPAQKIPKSKVKGRSTKRTPVLIEGREVVQKKDLDFRLGNFIQKVISGQALLIQSKKNPSFNIRPLHPEDQDLEAIPRIRVHAWQDGGFSDALKQLLDIHGKVLVVRGNDLAIATTLE